MSDQEELSIRVTATPDEVGVIKILRAATDDSMAQIRNALANELPIAVCLLYGTDHEKQKRNAERLFEELDRDEVKFDIILEGEAISRQYFDNLMARWIEIGVEVEMHADLESGEPCIETLEWLRSTGPRSVFEQTLQQVVVGDGYCVQQDTLEWARLQLAKLTGD